MSADGRRRLIVSADDYGLTVGCSTAILEAHLDGIVTSTSVLALGPGFASTAAWLRDHPRLGVGAHLAAVGEDPPLLSSREIPTLVDRSGRLWLSWRQFLPRAAAGRIDPDDLRREFSAQFDAIEGAGLAVDHVDSHQNLHLWPLVRDVVMELGEQRGVRAIRLTSSAASSVVGRVVGRLGAQVAQACADRGWVHVEASTGLDEAGHLDRPAMVAALDRLAATGAASCELATHPGLAADDDRVRYRWGYDWGDEREALCSPTVRAFVEEHGFVLSTFADLGQPA